tara:strand:+ start:145 stop:300 length:156 start_codon:yes stop_codon:yes gene_type:complete
VNIKNNNRKEQMNKKQLKKMVNWMYSKDNPNHKYNKKCYGSKKVMLKWLKI